MIITIDGPVASGKSSLARAIANKLNIYYLNTGYLYRALGYVMLHEPVILRQAQDERINPAVRPEGAKRVEGSNRTAKEILKKITYSFDGHNESIKYDNQDITKFLKTPEIDKASSTISLDADVRAALSNFKHELANKADLITDGRDCGSVVFPNADVKIYLTASLAVRAKRWQHDMLSKGMNYTLEEAENIIAARDKRDEERPISPLIIPEGAVVLDNSDMTQEETLDKALEIINKT